MREEEVLRRRATENLIHLVCKRRDPAHAVKKWSDLISGFLECQIGLFHCFTMISRELNVVLLYQRVEGAV